MRDNMSKIIRSEKFEGTIEHLRAIMQRLTIKYSSQKWECEDGQYIRFYEFRKTRKELVSVESAGSHRAGRYDIFSSPQRHYRTVDGTPHTRGSWEVTLFSQENKSIGFGGIEAYEKPDGTTLIEFHDGYLPDLHLPKMEPIGKPFEEFAEMIIREALEKELNLASSSLEFDRIASLAPQPRGREFQKLFARVIDELDSWLQEEGVRTPYEEIDVVVNREREYYLVECKWEQYGIGASVVRGFYGKLTNRANVQGIIVSMSGFTKGAVDEVKKKVSDRIILLFGPWDVCSIIFSGNSFDKLLNEKYDALVKRSKVLFC